MAPPDIKPLEVRRAESLFAPSHKRIQSCNPALTQSFSSSSNKVQENLKSRFEPEVEDVDQEFASRNTKEGKQEKAGYN